MNPLLYWSIVAIAVAAVAAAVWLFVELVSREVRIWREDKELARRQAYTPRHYLNEDQDTRELPAEAVKAAVAAAMSRIEVAA